MPLWTVIQVALTSLLAHKLRSFLAMLGIIIGVGSVIAMLALGSGAERRVMARLEAMGTNLLVVRPERRSFRGAATDTEAELTLQDAEAILREVSAVREVAPVVSGFAHLKYRDRDTRASVLGTTVTYLPVRAFEVERGRAFTEIEVESGAPVVLLGPDTARELFGEQDPLGQTVRIEQVACQVIGVLEPKGDQGWYNPDQQTLVPYPVAMRQLFGQRTLREIGIRMEDGADLQHAEAQVAALLRRRHQRRPGAGDDFRIRNQAELLDTYSSVSRTFTLLLGGIASISLLVGGIGIMNIMLVTVTERTREIGIRKAIGARERDILRQFLIEAVLMSGLGGLFGLLAGLGASWAFDRFSGFEIVLEPGAVALALGFAAAVGIFFGYYPARRAAALDPIEALRYE